MGYDDPKGAVAEAFRALRTSLSLSLASSKAKLLAVTSSVPSEGKSFVALNLSREKRDKPEVAFGVDQLRLSAYEGLGDETAAADVAERIKAREAVLHETVIARADALMANGNWGLADELLKSLKSDPQALVRRAEMALTMNRLEGAGQRMKEFEGVAASADEETRMRAAKVLGRLEAVRGTVSGSKGDGASNL